MISFTEQQTQFGDYSQNTSSANLARAAKLSNIEHRYLLQKFFSNEGSYAISTIGSQTLTSTASLLTSATSATLTTAWAYHTVQAYVTFSSGDVRTVQFTRNSTAITWAIGLTAAATTSLSVGGIQFYPPPPNYSKLKTVTITIGTLTWTPSEILSREQWDKLNVFPYYSDIPNNFFVYPGGDHGVQIGIWPIPSTTGNQLVCNYKFRVPDLSLADYSTGTVTVANGGTTVTGSGTSWTPTTNPSLESRWIQIAQTAGDNLWYQVDSVVSATSLTLYQPYQGIAVAGGTYTLGQMPLLGEDFQDMLIWKPLMFYWSTIVDKPEKFKEFAALYNEKLKQLDSYSGSNTVNVNLSRSPMGHNPNLYPQNLT